MKRNLKQIPIYIILTLVSAFVALPFFWMVTTSLKHQSKIFLFPPQWLPNPIMWSNFIDVFHFQPFHIFYWNSLYIAILTTIGTCFFAGMAGYAFAKIVFPFRNTVFLILLSSMMIPKEVTAIPLFIGMSKLGLVDTHFPIIVPPMLGTFGIFGVFVLRQFFITIPNDLDEAAKIDGCTPWKTFWRIMFPLAGPALATVCIFTFLHSWDEFFEPLIFINSNKLFTIPIAMALFTDQSGVAWHLLMAGAVMATLPLLIVFFLAQRKFIEGVSMTGIK